MGKSCLFLGSQGPGFVPLNVIDGDEQPEDAYAEEEARRSVVRAAVSFCAGPGMQLGVESAPDVRLTVRCSTRRSQPWRSTFCKSSILKLQHRSTSEYTITYLRLQSSIPCVLLNISITNCDNRPCAPRITLWRCQTRKLASAAGTPYHVVISFAPCRYFGWLADVASVSGVTVDVLAAGASAINVPLIAPVVAKSGGVLSLHEGVWPVMPLAGQVS